MSEARSMLVEIMDKVSYKPQTGNGLQLHDL